MSETRRYVELFMRPRIERNAVPFPERRRVAADVHDHVTDLPLDRQYQFALPGRILVVQPAQYALVRKRQVVLHEAFAETEIGELTLLPGFKKVTALIREHARADELQAGQWQVQDFHAQRASRPKAATSRK